MDRWEKPRGVETDGGKDSDGLKTGGKCRVIEMKRQAGCNSVSEQQVWRRKRRTCYECETKEKDRCNQSVISALKKSHQTSQIHPHTHTETLPHLLFHFTFNIRHINMQWTSPPHAHKYPAKTQLLPHHQSNHTSSHTQKLYLVNTLTRRGSIENMRKATTQQPWSGVLAKDCVEFLCAAADGSKLTRSMWCLETVGGDNRTVRLRAFSPTAPILSVDWIILDGCNQILYENKRTDREGNIYAAEQVWLQVSVFEI